ncbi:hypothetical protein [Salinigranum salinum]|uniref:hypothetical protein n=1 Tax=Salinigranum salinum TaxID=1364937 RepID=UPI00126042BA|nr:hypothetical protein [Salinigranum salinum]
MTEPVDNEEKNDIPKDELPIRDLVDQYFEALDSDIDKERRSEITETIEALEVRHEKFVREYGDDDPETVDLRKRIDELTEEQEQIDISERRAEVLADEIAERVVGFRLTEEWLDGRVLEGVNHVLVGEREPQLLVEGVRVDEELDASSLDEIRRLDLIDTVRQLAKDRLGTSTEAGDVWNSIQGSSYEVPFLTVATEGEATAKDVLSHVDEDISRDTAGARLRNASNKLSMNPYFRTDGVYSLSTVGKYLLREYAEYTDDDLTEKSENVERGEDEKGERDGSLSSFTDKIDQVTADGGDEDE